MSRTSVLAKLLATENIEVVYKGQRTAAFDVVNRVLYMPIWKEISKDLEDLLTGHEVGHALYTPADGWHGSDVSYDFPRSYINIIEDIRIERLVQNRYPGLKGSFKRGYMELLNRDFFGIAKRDIASLGFMDRLNIKTKVRDLMDVPFNSDELPYVKKAVSAETFEDVLTACQEIYDWLKEKKEDESKNAKASEQAQSEFTNDDFEPTSGDSETQDVSVDKSENGSSEAEVETKQDEARADDVQPSGEGSLPSTTEEEAVDEKPEESKSEPVKSAGDEGNIDDVMTDDNFRANEDKLVETDKWGKELTASIGVTPDTVKKIVVPFTEALEVRRKRIVEVVENSGDLFYHKMYNDSVEEFNTFMDETKKTVNTMAKEFEMRKAAFQHARAKTSKSGSLDVTKLHSYKFNDDLFLRSTTLADAKSHGLVAVIDFSGSMQDVIRNVVDQAIVLATFCRKVGIPFDIYSFTTSSFVMRERGLNQKESEIDLSSLSLVQQLSSDMNKQEFLEACRSLYVAYTRPVKSWGMPFMSDVDSLGGTPLNETLVVMNEILKKFKAKTNVQKVNFVTITDGEGGWLSLVGEGYPRKLSIRMNNKNLIMDESHRSTNTTILLEELRRQGINTVGYFIINRMSDLRYRFPKTYAKTDTRKNMRDDKVVQAEVKGYDTYFVLDGRQDAMDDEFEVKDNANKGDIVRAFKKFAKSKKGNRALAVQFAKAVA